MDVAKLTTFLIAAETKDLQVTARKIFRTQPAVTQQIQKLERELGIKLFEKKGRRLILTCQGEELFKRVQQPIQDLQSSIEDVLNRESIAVGTLRIGILADQAASCELFDSFAVFCLHHPKVDLQVTLGTSKLIEPMLLENRLDFGVLIYLAQPHLFAKHSLAPATHIPVCSATYLQSRKSLATCQELLEADLIDQDQEWWSWADWIEEHFLEFLQKLRQLKPRFTVTSYSAMKTIVLAGFGVAMLPEYLVQKELKAGTLVQLFTEKQSIKFDLTLVYRKSKNLRLCEQQFLKHLQVIA